ncbi:RHS repeat-associated core domain-containing protein [Clostridium sp. ZBS13]|uniref:RHS repeat-associated core domain-containing protein n=1 Tax=Clostridium sp. ZBS13 TaxID=2949971 RepID=UPI002079D19F|nr:RHS repeat-associated core domain-containing protein [Clostridium sp. ZBS13]
MSIALIQTTKAITKEGNRYDTEGLRCAHIKMVRSTTEFLKENEKLSRFIFNKNGYILVETDSDDNVISRFTRGYEVVAADIADKTNSSINYSLSRYYYSVDEQHSTDFITDDDGNIKNEYYYDAFGNVLDSKEEIHNRITYTGQQFDGITQQYYLRARFYNPVIGRFTQEDVYRGDGLNLYAYCGNNPVRYYDPSGYEMCPPGNNKENSWNNFQKENKGKYNSKQEMVDAYNKLKANKNEVTPNKPVIKKATEGIGETEVLKGKDVYGPHYEEAKQLFKEDSEFFSNPDKSIIVQGEDLKKARDDYNTLVSQGNLNKGHHKQGLAFGGENINDNITYTGESTIKSGKLEDLDLEFYSENGYGKENAKTLKIYKNEKGIYVFGNNPRHTAATNFQNKVLKWQRDNGLRK